MQTCPPVTGNKITKRTPCVIPFATRRIFRGVLSLFYRGFLQGGFYYFFSFEFPSDLTKINN